MVKSIESIRTTLRMLFCLYRLLNKTISMSEEPLRRKQLLRMIVAHKKGVKKTLVQKTRARKFSYILSLKQTNPQYNITHQYYGFVNKAG